MTRPELKSRSQMRRLSIQNPQALIDEIELLRGKLQQKGAEIEDWKRRRQTAIDVGERREKEKDGEICRFANAMEIYRDTLRDVLDANNCLEQLESVDKRVEQITTIVVGKG